MALLDEQYEGGQQDHGPIGDDVHPVHRHHQRFQIIQRPGLPARLPEEPQVTLQGGDFLSVDQALGAGVGMDQTLGEHVDKIRTHIQGDFTDCRAVMPNESVHSGLGPAWWNRPKVAVCRPDSHLPRRISHLARLRPRLRENDRHKKPSAEPEFHGQERSHDQQSSTNGIHDEMITRDGDGE